MYKTERGSLQFRAAVKETDGSKVPFFAFDRQAAGTVPVSARESEGGIRLSLGDRSEQVDASFYALPADSESPPPGATPLYEYVRETDGKREYTTDAGWSGPGFKRVEVPVCLVWRNPWSAAEATEP